MKTKIVDKFLIQLKHLENRRNMYVFGDTYFELANFITGYSIGIKDCTEIDILKDFQEWFKNKQKKQFSVHWSIYIYKYLAKNDDKKAEILVINLLEEYLKSYQV